MISLKVNSAIHDLCCSLLAVLNLFALFRSRGGARNLLAQDAAIAGYGSAADTVAAGTLQWAELISLETNVF